MNSIDVSLLFTGWAEIMLSQPSNWFNFQPISSFQFYLSRAKLYESWMIFVTDGHVDVLSFQNQITSQRKEIKTDHCLKFRVLQVKHGMAMTVFKHLILDLPTQSIALDNLSLHVPLQSLSHLPLQNTLRLDLADNRAIIHREAGAGWPIETTMLQRFPPSPRLTTEPT